MRLARCRLRAALLLASLALAASPVAGPTAALERDLDPAVESPLAPLPAAPFLTVEPWAGTNVSGPALSASTTSP